MKFTWRKIQLQKKECNQSSD